MEQHRFSSQETGRRRVIGTIALIAAVTTGALALAGCGVRGGLEAPREDVGVDSTEKSSSDQRKSHKPFILDGLIR